MLGPCDNAGIMSEDMARPCRITGQRSKWPGPMFSFAAKTEITSQQAGKANPKATIGAQT